MLAGDKQAMTNSQARLPDDFAGRIRRLRAKLGLTQRRLAEYLNVSFASVNRWENEQSRPNRLAWDFILRAEQQIDRQKLDTMVTNFVETIGNLFVLEFVGLEEQAQAVEHIGRRLRDECCGAKLRGHAILANQILTIATTRMA